MGSWNTHWEKEKEQKRSSAKRRKKKKKVSSWVFWCVRHYFKAFRNTIPLFPTNPSVTVNRKGSLIIQPRTFLITDLAKKLTLLLIKAIAPSFYKKLQQRTSLLIFCQYFALMNEWAQLFRKREKSKEATRLCINTNHVWILFVNFTLLH